MTRRSPASAIVLSALVLVLVLVAGCRPAPEAPPELPDPPSIVAEMPAARTVADEGHPGDWVPLEGLSPAARAFCVGPDAAPGQGSGPAPGVLIVHGTWGLNRDVRLLARTLANRGVVACAPDLYDGIFAGSRLGAAELVESVSAERAGRTIAAARAALQADPRVGGKPVVLLVLGHGARWAVPAVAADASGLARIVFDNPPVALFHERAPALKPPVLILAGEHSSAYDAARRAALDEAFRAAGVTLTWDVIPAAGTDLLDPRAIGFSREAYDVTLGKVAALVRSAG